MQWGRLALAMAGAMAVCVAAAGQDAGEAGLVLDETGYFRQHVEFGLMKLNSDVLRRDGEKLFGNGLRRLERDVRKLLGHKGYDWEKADWRDAAVLCFVSAQVGDDRGAIARLPSVRPPADWAQPGFDDSAWDRFHRGLEPWQSLGWIAYQQSTLFRRAYYLRTYFEVPDPAKATGLTLKLAYRGGARVLVNGVEVGRGHLPDGEITSETFAADYPPDAYVATKDELPQRPAWGEFVGDLRCRYDQAPPWRRGGDFRTTYGETAVNRKGWDRLMRLRDRTLGPLEVPQRLLRKGSNVLAIEVRTSRYHPLIVPLGEELWRAKWGTDLSHNPRWDHVRLVGLELRGAAPTCLRRAPGAQAWAVDMHTRLYDRDHNPAGWPTGAVRLVAAQNGTFAGQVGVGADRELTGLRAACSPLAGPDGAAIPAEAAQIGYMVGHGLDALLRLGTRRSVERPAWHDHPMLLAALYRWGNPARGIYPWSVTNSREQLQFVQGFKFFDHITGEPPEKVPAGTCQPVWLSLKVPADTPPGRYQGAVRITADGSQPLVVPVEAEVIGWRVPDPQQLQTIVQSEQSPYGVAKGYGVPVWSDEHFRLIETSFRQLARLGTDWVFVPVLADSELGNRSESPIRWIRHRDGSLGFDYAILDRYLAMARKHLGIPKGICFTVMHGCGTHTVEVTVQDEATGRPEAMAVGPSAGPRRVAVWRAFAASLCDHMTSLGLRQAMFWGHAFDETPDPGLIGILAQVAPDVGWAAGSHGRVPDQTFRACGRAYGVELPPRSVHGWKNPFIHLLLTRYAGSVICVEGTSTPFTYRVMCDRAIHCGFSGLGRVGADYFDWTWFDGCRANQYNIAGRAILQTLWPGKSAVESSARNEAMLEGLQEAEARIFIEQALDRGVLPADLAREAEAVLEAHFLGTAHICAGAQDLAAMDLTNGWQARSRRLYAMAAEVARQVGMDVDRTSFGRTEMMSIADGEERKRTVGTEVAVPALGRSRLPLVLRNWTDRPRAWRAASDQPWIVPEKPEGTVSGQQELGIVLDGTTLRPGEEMAGTLTVTDAASGTAYPVRIAARVTKAVEFRIISEVKFVTGGGSGSDMPHELIVRSLPVFNVPAGGEESREYLLINHTGAPQDWELESSHPCLVLGPAKGKIAPGASSPVRLTVRPMGKAAYALEPTLTLRAAGGKVAEECPVKLFVIPPYREPSVPAGDVVWLRELDAQKRVKRHVDYGFDMRDKSRDRMQRPWWAGALSHSRVSRPCGENIRAEVFKWKSTPEQEETYPYTIAGKKFTRGLWVVPGHETVYHVESAGFAAFAAEVGFYDKYGQDRMANLGARVAFEAYVDGALRAHSGIVAVGDKPRLLVVTGLEKAREIRLVTRRDDLSNDENCLATWADPRFIKAKP